MILVDVEIPVMGVTYDFQIDENVKTADLAAELRDAICLQRQCGSVGAQNALTLWDADRRLRLPDDKTPHECGITTGMKLILV